MLKDFIKEKKLAVIIALIVIILGSVFYFGIDAKAISMKTGANAIKQPITGNNVVKDSQSITGNPKGVLV